LPLSGLGLTVIPGRRQVGCSSCPRGERRMAAMSSSTATRTGPSFPNRS
jgi:hypothetical protein